MNYPQQPHGRQQPPNPYGHASQPPHGYPQQPIHGQPPYPGQPPYYAPPGYGQQQGPAPVVPGSGVSLAAMIVGIASIPLFFFYGVVGLVAIVLGCVGFSTTKKATGKGSGRALAGIITGSISVITLLSAIGIVVFFVADAASELQKKQTELVERYEKAEFEVKMISDLVLDFEQRFQRLPETLQEVLAESPRSFSLKDPWDRDYQLYLFHGGFSILSEGRTLEDDDDIVYNSLYDKVEVPSPLPRLSGPGSGR